MVDILFTVTQKDYDELRIIRAACGFENDRELISNALTLLKWVVDETVGGGELAVLEGKEGEQKAKILDAKFLKKNKVG